MKINIGGTVIEVYSCPMVDADGTFKDAKVLPCGLMNEVVGLRKRVASFERRFKVLHSLIAGNDGAQTKAARDHTRPDVRCPTDPCGG